MGTPLLNAPDTPKSCDGFCETRRDDADRISGMPQEAANIPTPLTFEQFREQWLSEITEGNPSTVELGRRFAQKLIVQWLDLDESTGDLVYCDGSGDGGIDAAYLDRGQEEGAEEAAPGHT